MRKFPFFARGRHYEISSLSDDIEHSVCQYSLLTSSQSGFDELRGSTKATALVESRVGAEFVDA